MHDITQILQQVTDEDDQARSDLYIAVYQELRQLAERQLKSERPGQTLQATALVHEVWLKLLAPMPKRADPDWQGRRHFFAAAAEAMRRILVDNARRRNRLKRGGDLHRTELNLDEISENPEHDMLQALDEALQRFQSVDAKASELVKLRYFCGMSQQDACQVLNIAPRTADRLWVYAKAWLLREISTSAG